MSNLITINEVVIRQDGHGLFCLNDLHKSAGGEKRHQPGDWLRLRQTKGLIKVLSLEDESIPGIPGIEPNQVVRSVAGNGTNSGTYVCKDLVYDYAMWISPKFRARVIRTFDVVVTNRVEESVKSVYQLAKDQLEFLASAGQYFGCPTHLAQIEVTKAIKRDHDIDISHLLASAPAQSNIKEKEIMLEPTELSKLYGVSARGMNTMLAGVGLQVKVDGSWTPTEKGKGMCTKHAWKKGTKSGYNLKWNAEKVKEYL